MIAYKIFRRHPSGLTSLIIYDKYKVIYHKDKINKRKDGCGGFACFNSMINLIKFQELKGWKNKILFPVYEVDITLCKKQLLYSPEHDPLRQLPIGTIVAETLKIIREIE